MKIFISLSKDTRAYETLVKKKDLFDADKEIGKVETAYTEQVSALPVGTQKKNSKIINEGKTIISTAFKMHKFLKVYNMLKTKMDKAFTAGNVKAFLVIQKELAKIMKRYGFSGMEKSIRNNKKWMHVLTPMRRRLTTMFDTINNNVRGAENWVRKVCSKDATSCITAEASNLCTFTPGTLSFAGL